MFTEPILDASYFDTLQRNLEQTQALPELPEQVIISLDENPDGPFTLLDLQQNLFSKRLALFTSTYGLFEHFPLHVHLHILEIFVQALSIRLHFTREDLYDMFIRERENYNKMRCTNLFQPAYQYLLTLIQNPGLMSTAEARDSMRLAFSAVLSYKNEIKEAESIISSLEMYLKTQSLYEMDIETMEHPLIFSTHELVKPLSENDATSMFSQLVSLLRQNVSLNERQVEHAAVFISRLNPAKTGRISKMAPSLFNLYRGMKNQELKLLEGMRLLLSSPYPSLVKITQQTCLRSLERTPQEIINRFVDYGMIKCLVEYSTQDTALFPIETVTLAQLESIDRPTHTLTFFPPISPQPIAQNVERHELVCTPLHNILSRPIEEKEHDNEWILRKVISPSFRYLSHLIRYSVFTSADLTILHLPQIVFLITTQHSQYNSTLNFIDDVNFYCIGMRLFALIEATDLLTDVLNILQNGPKHEWKRTSGSRRGLAFRRMEEEGLADLLHQRAFNSESTDLTHHLTRKCLISMMGTNLTVPAEPLP
ncbi:hypothetical protein BLNAU_4304 [Blattamonas nauphoetae]|uniref:Uncharacterized protein n=1 Tax=Blattamonas nauphoetae TaxID=2049346 RepID=A0ABQ9YAJ2_9EUKA|nr:hypothetical protein BLNAU_4304 [Blattamonas nauphoetae]